MQFQISAGRKNEKIGKIKKRGGYLQLSRYPLGRLPLKKGILVTNGVSAKWIDCS